MRVLTIQGGSDQGNTVAQCRDICVHALSLLCLYFSVWLLSTIRWRSGMLIQRACRQETGIQEYNDELNAFIGSIYYTVDFGFCLNIVHLGSDWCLLAFFGQPSQDLNKFTAHCVDALFTKIRGIQTELKSIVINSECSVSHINFVGSYILIHKQVCKMQKWAMKLVDMRDWAFWQCKVEHINFVGSYILIHKQVCKMQKWAMKLVDVFDFALFIQNGWQPLFRLSHSVIKWKLTRDVWFIAPASDCRTSIPQRAM